MGRPVCVCVNTCMLACVRVCIQGGRVGEWTCICMCHCVGCYIAQSIHHGRGEYNGLTSKSAQSSIIYHILLNVALSKS